MSIWPPTRKPPRFPSRSPPRRPSNSGPANGSSSRGRAPVRRPGGPQAPSLSSSNGVAGAFRNGGRVGSGRSPSPRSPASPVRRPASESRGRPADTSPFTFDSDEGSDGGDPDWEVVYGKPENEDTVGLGMGGPLDEEAYPLDPLNKDTPASSVLGLLGTNSDSTRNLLDAWRDPNDAYGPDDTDDTGGPEHLLQRETPVAAAGSPDGLEDDDSPASPPYSTHVPQDSVVRLRPDAPKTPSSSAAWDPWTRPLKDDFGGSGGEPYSAGSESVHSNAHENTGDTVTTDSHNPLAALSRYVNGVKLIERLSALAKDSSTSNAEKEQQLGKLLTWMGPERLFNWEISGHAYQLGLAAVASGALSAVATWKLRNLMDRCSSFWMG